MRGRGEGEVQTVEVKEDMRGERERHTGKGISRGPADVQLGPLGHDGLAGRQSVPAPSWRTHVGLVLWGSQNHGEDGRQRVGEGGWPDRGVKT